MEIHNQGLDQFVKDVIPQPAIAFNYEILNETITIDVVDPIYKDLPFELKKKVSFAELEISKEEFEQIVKMKV